MDKDTARKLAQLKREMKEKKLNVSAEGFTGGGIGAGIKSIRGISKSMGKQLAEFTKKKKQTGIKGLSKDTVDRLTAYAKRPKKAVISMDEITSIQKAREFGSTCNKAEYQELKNAAREAIKRHRGNAQRFKQTGKNRYRNNSEKARQQEILYKEALSEYKGSPDVLKISDKSVAKSWQDALDKDTR